MMGLGKQRFEIGAADRDWMTQIGWRSVDDVLACGSNNVAAVSRSSDVVRVPVDPSLGGPTVVFVKRYMYPRRSQRIKQMFRGTLLGKSRARWEYEFLSEMCKRGVPTVRPIAYGERRRGAFVHAGFVITDGSDQGKSLDLFALDLLRRCDQGRSERRVLTDGLASVIQKMHDAGVRHGGLYWRNILVHTQSDGTYWFSLLDPDTHGRLLPSAVSDEDVVADVSELLASAIALGLRGGLLRFAKAYYGVRVLSVAQRHLMAEALKRGRPLARAERKRMAITEAIAWLRKRVAAGRQHSGGASAIESLDEFFDVLRTSTVRSDRRSSTSKTIHFSFSSDDAVGDALERCVILEGDRFTVTTTDGSEPNLLIRSDAQTWLAVIAGRPEAYARVRAGKLRLQGDTQLLPTLIASIDGEMVARPAQIPRAPDGFSGRETAAQE